MIYSFCPDGGRHLIYLPPHSRGMFPGADVYYAPFIAPDGNGNYKISSFRDTLPENNPAPDALPAASSAAAPRPLSKVAKEPRPRL